ncbi:MAG: hypothetical protein ACOH1J_06350 [Microbacteriaceae bacterium]
MYEALWQAMPGPFWLRLVIFGLILLGVLAVLSTWVFPFVDQLIAPQEVTVKE